LLVSFSLFTFLLEGCHLGFQLRHSGLAVRQHFLGFRNVGTLVAEKGENFIEFVLIQGSHIISGHDEYHNNTVERSLKCSKVAESDYDR
jgi:hypothetical protein